MSLAGKIAAGISLWWLASTAFLAWLVVRHRGEESGVPEEPVPEVSLDEARAAIDEVLADPEETTSRFAAMVNAEPALARVYAQLDRQAAKRRWRW